MKITLLPTVSSHDDIPPTVSLDTISYRGESYDLSQLSEGGEVEASDPFIGKITRDTNGAIHLTLQYRYTTQTAESVQSMNIEDYTFDVTSGECPCPIKRKPIQEPTE
ncbi:hypothetical protein [Idiomarina xiamenensis]|uniref:Uncharacterized protein n=1 Tax=Idiomarina xiamenensis 10-D-4 TaxID=740709 RepID=K2J6A6_9GAMM|nr:hypothetical protein [Idiomarina xiamenensis]EKE78591.1 hypothetical protein A10D4_13331 [Idiomarina xiamenensis 10-D-4]